MEIVIKAIGCEVAKTARITARFECNRETILTYSVLICTCLDASEEYVALWNSCLKVF